MGKLPKYLIEFKETEMEKKRQEALIDPNCPIGHVPLNDDDRQQHIQFTKDKEQELINELNRLPMTSNTLRVRNRRIEIERELRNLDEVIKTYSKIKVYVKQETIINSPQSQLGT